MGNRQTHKKLMKTDAIFPFNSVSLFGSKNTTLIGGKTIPLARFFQSKGETQSHHMFNEVFNIFRPHCGKRIRLHLQAIYQVRQRVWWTSMTLHTKWVPWENKPILDFFLPCLLLVLNPHHQLSCHLSKGKKKIHLLLWEFELWIPPKVVLKEILVQYPPLIEMVSCLTFLFYPKYFALFFLFFSTSKTFFATNSYYKYTHKNLPYLFISLTVVICNYSNPQKIHYCLLITDC